jgi:hypothetical protein
LKRFGKNFRQLTLVTVAIRPDFQAIFRPARKHFEYALKLRRRVARRFVAFRRLSWHRFSGVSNVFPYFHNAARRMAQLETRKMKPEFGRRN